MAVLGAGLQGMLAALALARAGWSVEVLDRSPSPMEGASVRGEGKLHLGYVYANDPGRATAGLMVEGALRFAELVDRWVPGGVDWASLRSDPFLYGVLADSLVGPDDLAEHYAWVDELVAAALAGGCTYAGAARARPARRLADPAAHGLGPSVVAAFATDEVAIDPVGLRTDVLGAADTGGAVGFRGETTVEAVARAPEGFVVTTRRHGEVQDRRADAVVNCLWDGRLAVDGTMGLAPERPWIHRLKHAVRGRVPAGAAPPSATLVLGPYGDVVHRGGGRVYASWYPVCLTATSTELAPPPGWATSAEGRGGATPEHLAADTVAALRAHVPGLTDLAVDAVGAGVIVAWGERDIDVPESELHRRHEVGVHEHDGYLSVDTGKLTTAPLFAERVAEVLGR